MENYIKGNKIVKGLLRRVHFTYQRRNISDKIKTAIRAKAKQLSTLGRRRNSEAPTKVPLGS